MWSYLQYDGFAGYETAFKTNPGVQLVNCLVHIRRHFEQALDENREMAEYGLTQIQQVYKIEHGCNEATPTVESYPIKMSQKDIAMKMERSKMEAIIKTIAFSLFRYIEPALLP